MGRTGAYYYGQYADESSFKGGGTMTRVLGFNHKYSDVTPNENINPLPQHNSQEIQKFTYGLFAGSFNAEWVVSNPWFFSGLLGSPVTTGSNPYTHTFSLSKAKKTHTHEIGFAADTENFVRTLLGSVWNQVTLSSTINQPLTARGSAYYAQEGTPTTTLDSSIPADDLNFPYTFEHGSIELPNSTVLAEVQSIEVTINPNPIPISGHNDKFAASCTWGEFTVTGRINMTVKDRALLTSVLGRAEVATMKLTFTNGLTSTNEKSITMSFTGIGMGEHAISYSPNEVVFQNFPIQARQLSVVAVNAISAIP